jgi:hypothetical protein
MIQWSSDMIRVIIGLLLAFGAVGGLDNNEPVIPCLFAAVVGLFIMYSGVSSRSFNEIR